jgi:hypothetical protein
MERVNTLSEVTEVLSDPDFSLKRAVAAPAVQGTATALERSDDDCNRPIFPSSASHLREPGHRRASHPGFPASPMIWDGGPGFQFLKRIFLDGDETHTRLTRPAFVDWE